MVMTRGTASERGWRGESTPTYPDSPDAREEDLQALSLPLPPPIARCKEAGRIGEVIELCRERLEHDPAGPCAARLRIEWFRLARLARDYCVPLSDVPAGLAVAGARVSSEDVERLVARGLIDVRFIEGEPHALASYADTLRVHADAVPGLAAAPDDHATQRAARDEMAAQGGAARIITLRSSLAVPGAEDGDAVRIWLPVAAEASHQSRIEVLDASSGGCLAPPAAPARTISWECTGPAERAVTYRLHVAVPYIDLWDASPHEGGVASGGATGLCAAGPAFPTEDAGPVPEDLAEMEPHIRFTPLVRLVARKIKERTSTSAPLELARAVYEYVTRHIAYRYQPAYLQLDAIPDYCLSSGFGDCGVMALTFIALCRCLGVPARWQSGVYAAPDAVYPHDWAQFYTPETGWRWVDCSAGVSALQAGDEELQRFYFGNIDPWHVAFNRAFQAPLQPVAAGIRRDPFDNQLGEASVEGRFCDAAASERSLELIEARASRCSTTSPASAR